MNQATERQVQRLGKLRQRRQQLEAQEQELSRAVRSVMSEHGMSVVRSADFEARLVRQDRLEVSPAAFHRAVTKKEFFEAATISVTAARKIIGDRKLRRISEVTEAVQLRVTARQRRTAAPSPSQASQQAIA